MKQKLNYYNDFIIYCLTLSLTELPTKIYWFIQFALYGLIKITAGLKESICYIFQNVKKSKYYSKIEIYLSNY